MEEPDIIIRSSSQQDDVVGVMTELQTHTDEMDDDGEKISKEASTLPTRKRSKKNNELTLEQKLRLIEYAESKCMTFAELSRKFGVSTATISRVLKRKEEYVEMSFEDLSASRKRKPRSTAFSTLNQMVYHWYLDNREREGGINGPALRDQARVFARELNMKDFKASNGWLDGFRNRHHIGVKMSPRFNRDVSELSGGASESLDDHSSHEYGGGTTVGALLSAMQHQELKLEKMMDVQKIFLEQMQARAELDEKRWELLMGLLGGENGYKKINETEFVENGLCHDEKLPAVEANNRTTSSSSSAASSSSSSPPPLPMTTTI